MLEMFFKDISYVDQGSIYFYEVYIKNRNMKYIRIENNYFQFKI